MTTPQTQDLFSRFMAEAFDDREVIGASTALQGFFGNPASQNPGRTIFSPDANVVDIDIVRGNEKIAALIPRGTVSRSLGSLQSNLQDGKHSTFSRKYPLAEEEGDINADMILNRIPGENPLAGNTRMGRMRYHAFQIHLESIRRIVRMNEVLAAQSLLTGKQDAIIGTTNTDLQYDFRRNSTHTVTVGTAWSNVAADALGDIDGICKKIRANGRATPNIVIMGDGSFSNFIKNTTVLAQADNKRFELIEVSTGNPVPGKYNRFVEGGLIPRGRLRTPGGFTVWMFTYIDGYDNSGGTFTKFILDDQVLIGSVDARCDRYFGPPERLPIGPTDRALYMEYFGFSLDAPPMPIVKAAGGVIDPNMFHSDAYKSVDRKKITVRTQSAPIFATTHTDAFGVLDTAP
ncbi:MAG: major capsid protein [Nitrospinaceae bacterium]